MQYSFDWGTFYTTRDWAISVTDTLKGCSSDTQWPQRLGLSFVLWVSQNVTCCRAQTQETKHLHPNADTKVVYV